MEKAISLDKRCKDYVVSMGIVPLIRNRFGVDLDRFTASKVRDIELEFADELRSVLAKEKQCYDYHVLDDKEIVTGIQKTVAMTKNPLVVYDDVYGIKGDLEISSTRLTDPDSFETVIGERPGAATIETQRQMLADMFAGKTIDVYDIGVFSGETLLEEVQETYPKYGIDVENIFLGIANKDVVKKFSDIANVCVLNDFVFGEWLEIRDPLFLDGRKVYRNGNLSHIPKETQLIIPYSENASWSSISEENMERYNGLCSKYHGKLKCILKEAGLDLIKNEVYKSKTGTSVYEVGVKYLSRRA